MRPWLARRRASVFWLRFGRYSAALMASAAFLSMLRWHILATSLQAAAPETDDPGYYKEENPLKPRNSLFTASLSFIL